jgi:hypothetical protein
MAPNEMTTGENKDARQPSAVEVARLDERLTALSRSVGDRFEANEKQTALAMSAAEKAVTKAEAASEKRFEGVNEFRGALTDYQKNLITRSEVETQIKAINDRIEDKIDGPNGLGPRMSELSRQVSTLSSRLTGKEEGSHEKATTHDTSFQQWIAVIAVLVSLVAIGVVVFKGSQAPQVVYEPAVPQVPSGAK